MTGNPKPREYGVGDLMRQLTPEALIENATAADALDAAGLADLRRRMSEKVKRDYSPK